MSASNSSLACPITSSNTSIIDHWGDYPSPTRDHMACYAPYLAGREGKEVSDRLAGCCNGTVAVVYDDSISMKTPGCFYYCNVTAMGQKQLDTAEGFNSIEKCLSILPDYYGNKTGVRCYPRDSKLSNEVRYISIGFVTKLLGISALTLSALVNGV